MHFYPFPLLRRAFLVAAISITPNISFAVNLIVNNGFENNPPGPTIGNHIPWPILPWTLEGAALANVVTVNGGVGYGNGGPNLDAEETQPGTLQHYLDINGGAKTVSQTFTVPTCGATDMAPRAVNFSGYFSVRDSAASVGSGYIRIVDQSVLDNNGFPVVLKTVPVTNLRSTDAGGNIVSPMVQTWKQFGDSVEVMPGHRITYQAYFTDNLNFDNAYMAFSDFVCPSTTLAMAKQWNGAANGHQATLTATRDDGTTVVDTLVARASSSTGPTVQDTSPFTVFAGDKIRISEALANTGTTTYSKAMSCTGDTTVTGVDDNVFEVEVGSVSANTAPIVCTLVNTNVTQSTLTLRKQWLGAQEGDVAEVSAMAAQSGGAAPALLASTATSLANGADGQLQSGPATVVAPGAVFTVLESIKNATTSPAAYDQALLCQGATVNGSQVTVDTTVGTQAVCTMRNTLAALAIDKQASVPADTNGSGVVGDVGDQVTYSFTVTNTGKADLVSVQINDAMLAAAQVDIVWDAGAPPTTLPVGREAQAKAVYTLTTADMASPGGVLTNTATASAATAGSAAPVASPPDSATVPVVASHPAISITKRGAAADSNGSGLVGDVGDLISYQFTITNTGDTRLTGVNMTDALVGLSPIVYGAWPGAVGDLQPMESVNAYASYAIQDADVAATKVDNQATASANTLAGVTPTAQSPLVSIPTVASQPKLAISKVAVVTDTNTSGTNGDAGDVISYTLTVSNVGNVQLSGVSIIDPLSGLSALSIQWPNPALPGVLKKGAKAVATATYTIQTSDVGAGQVVNTATAKAMPVAGMSVEEVSDSASILTKGAPLLMPTPVPTLGIWSLSILSVIFGVIGFARRTSMKTE